MSRTMTNAEFAVEKSINVAQYSVKTIRECEGTFSHGLNSDSYQKRYRIVNILLNGKPVIRGIRCVPSTYLCLPDRHIQADQATDEEIILAIVGDESIFPNYGF